MIECARCGHRNDAVAKFCATCGTPVAAMQPPQAGYAPPAMPGWGAPSAPQPWPAQVPAPQPWPAPAPAPAPAQAAWPQAPLAPAPLAMAPAAAPGWPAAPGAAVQQPWGGAQAEPVQQVSPGAAPADPYQQSPYGAPPWGVPPPAPQAPAWAEAPAPPAAPAFAQPAAVASPMQPVAPVWSPQVPVAPVQSTDPTAPATATAASAVMPMLEADQIAPNAPRTLAGFLVSYEGDPLGQFWPLLQGVSALGRKDAGAGAAIEIDHPTTSSRHAKLYAAARPGRVKVEDLGSTNGTFVNDRRLESGERRVLQHGDTVRFGGFSVTVILV